MSEEKSLFCIHFILKDKVILKQYKYHVPFVGDEIRIGGEGHEKFYGVVRRVWVYDEPENPFNRINIEISDIK